MTVPRQPSHLGLVLATEFLVPLGTWRTTLVTLFGVLALVASCGSGGQQSAYVVCVQCVANSDCKMAEQPVCDSASHTCVGCTKGGDCAQPVPICDPASHTCVGCVNDEGCASPTPQCDLATETCVACVDNTGCTSAAAPYCNLARHTCVGCVDSAGCTPPASYCNQLTNTCEDPDAGVGRGRDAAVGRG